MRNCVLPSKSAVCDNYKWSNAAGMIPTPDWKMTEHSVWTAVSFHPLRCTDHSCVCVCGLPSFSIYSTGNPDTLELFPSSLAESWISWMSKMDVALVSTKEYCCKSVEDFWPKLDDKAQTNPLLQYTQSKRRPMLYFCRASVCALVSDKQLHQPAVSLVQLSADAALKPKHHPPHSSTTDLATNFHSSHLPASDQFLCFSKWLWLTDEKVFCNTVAALK